MASRGMWKAVIVGVAVMAVVVPRGDTVFGSTGTWSTKAPMPTPRYGHGVGVVNGIVYAVGGYSTSYLNTVEAYDPSTNTWSTKAPMPTARCCLGVVGVNGILYAVGGVNGIGLLNTVEAYNPSTNTWSPKAPMPTERSGLGMGAVNGTIYAVGGVSIGLLDTVEAYDPTANTWSIKASMPTPRADLAVGEVHGILYAAGGTVGGVAGMMNRVEAYDPGANTWSTKAAMPTARTELGVGVANGTLAAVGGAANVGVLNTVEIYDPTTNSWSTDAPMPTARQSLGVVGVNGIVYAIGGYGGTAGILGTNEAFAPAVPVAAFAAFAVKADIVPSAQAFAVRGIFTLGAGSAINPLTDSVTVQVGAASLRIPGGSFALYGDDRFHTAGGDLVYVVIKVLDGEFVEGIIVPLGGNRFAFEIGAVGVRGLPGTNPVTVRLTIGNTTGSASVDASFETGDE